MVHERSKVGLATCKRILIAHSAIPDVQVSALATVAAVKAVINVLKKGAASAVAIMAASGKGVTVNMKIIVSVFVDKFTGVHLLDVEAIHTHTKSNKPAIPKASVVKVFRSGLRPGDHIGKDAALALSSIAEAYLRTLAKNAALLTKAAHRVTIQEADILGAQRFQC